jgi:hypothetical protein
MIPPYLLGHPRDVRFVPGARSRNLVRYFIGSTLKFCPSNPNYTQILYFFARISNTVTDTMKEKRVRVVYNCNIVKVEDGRALGSDDIWYDYDALVWATGAAPQELNRRINVQRDELGYLKAS